MKTYLGIEIGGTKQQIAAVGEDGRLLWSKIGRVELKRGAADILEWIGTELTRVMEDSGLEVEAVGVGFGGIVETVNDRLAASIQVPGWENFSLRAWIADRSGKPAVVANDTVAGGYAEQLYGSGQGSRHFFYTNIGTGIGGATFIDGKNLDGIGYGTSYFGHTYTAVPDEFRQFCNGWSEKVEKLCAGPAIERRLHTEGYVPEDSLLYCKCGGHIEALTCRELAAAADDGDAFAIREIDAFAKAYAVGLANYITLLSPDRIAIGGGVANLGERILEPVRRYTAQLVFVSAKGRYEIVPCKFGDQVVALGAALLARDGFQTV